MVIAKIIVVLQKQIFINFLSRFGTTKMNILQGLNKSQTEATKVIRIKGKTLAADSETSSPIKKPTGKSPLAKPNK